MFWTTQRKMNSSRMRYYRSLMQLLFQLDGCCRFFFGIRKENSTKKISNRPVSNGIWNSLSFQVPSIQLINCYNSQEVYSIIAGYNELYGNNGAYDLTDWNAHSKWAVVTTVGYYKFCRTIIYKMTPLNQPAFEWHSTGLYVVAVVVSLLSSDCASLSHLNYWILNPL